MTVVALYHQHHLIWRLLKPKAWLIYRVSVVRSIAVGELGQYLLSRCGERSPLTGSEELPRHCSGCNHVERYATFQLDDMMFSNGRVHCCSAVKWSSKIYVFDETKPEKGMDWFFLRKL